MKKTFKVITIMALVVICAVTLVACAPTHNAEITLDKLKSLTIEMSRDDILASLGKPLAFDSKQVDWDNHGYDMLVYSPDDVAILDWYKARAKGDYSNLLGFASNLHWTNSTWELKYYTGTSPVAVAPFDYTLAKITFKNFQPKSVIITKYTKGASAGEELQKLEIKE